jgi:twinkle protein
MSGATSKLLHHGPCDCGSSDAKAVYDDGHAFCYSCNTHFPASGEEIVAERVSSSASGLLLNGAYQALVKRGIKEDTCRKFGYKVAMSGMKPVQIAPYTRDGEIVAQKLRYPGKEFRFVGDTEDVELFGQSVWRSGGKRIVITEGEIDAMSVAQAFNNRWPAVSVANGASGAKRHVAKQLEFLEGYDEVVIAFDNDEPGRKAAKEVASLLTPGKAKIVSWPGGIKDANDLIQKGQEGLISQYIFEAKEYRPDGILAGTELKRTLDEFRLGVSGYFSFDTIRPGVNAMTRGFRKGELVMLAAGTGVGKSTEAAELAHDFLTRHKLTVGYVALEENPLRTSLRMMSIHLNRPLHLSLEDIREEEYNRAYLETVGSGRFFLYDHFGSLDSDNLLSKLKFMANGCGCDFIVIDHISIATSGIAEGDERRMIDVLMTNLRSLVEQTGVGVIAICHLKKPQGSHVAHEEGGRVTLDDLRGSGSLKQLSDTVIGIERNQQDPDSKDECLLRVLKCRFTGETGIADRLKYVRQTGRLVPVEKEVLHTFEEA